MTSFNPTPLHLQAVQEDFGTGIATPSYGGTVNTGAEWDFVIDKHGRRSRTPSRSPNRAISEQQTVHRSSSLSQSFQPAGPLSYDQNIGSSSSSTSPPAQHITPSTSNTYPGASMMHHEPTITEEAAAVVDRSVRTSTGNGSRNGMVSSGSGGVKADKVPRTRMVGDWQLQKTLGAGSMGKVKLATNVHTKERCAVKIIPRYTDSNRKDPPTSPEEIEKQRLKDESKETRTVREAAISLLLHHPYICGMREFIPHPNHHYMVCEFIDGGQMLDYIISHGRLRERAARKFARQIGSALEYCHKNSIVHRDLKIENILISKNGNIKIIDFGLSNLFAPDRHLSTFCGSLYFAAPELLNAKVYTGPEVDVWSFGIVLYVLVCGKVPFDDQSMPALHAKIKRGLVEYPAWLSSECKYLLGRMLVTNPVERATLTEVLSSPFMNKGYDGPPDSHLIQREPLRAEELDGEVIKAMGGFTFGSPQEILEELRGVLSSDSYLNTLGAWENRRDRNRRGPGGGVGVGGMGPTASSSSMALSEGSDSPKKKRFSGFDFKKKLFKEEKKAEEPLVREKELLDPTRGFDPLISIYYLAREKMERERVYGKGQFASSQTSLDTPGVNGGMNGGGVMASGFGMALPSLPPPASTHTGTTAVGFEAPPGSPRLDYAAAQPRSRAGAGDVPNPVMQHPMADRETTDIADVPTAHHRIPVPGSPLQASPIPSGNGNESNGGTRKFGLLGKSKSPPSTAPSQLPLRSSSTSATFNTNTRQEATPSPSMPPPIEHRRSSTMMDKKSERRVSVGSVSTSMGRASLGRKGSQQRTAPLQTQIDETGSTSGSGWVATPNENSPDSATPPTREPEPLSLSSPDPSVGIELEPTSAPSPGYTHGDVKNVYLKGLFSVSTTSTKPAATLIRDIDTVLGRIGIKHRLIKGGFECVHIPSIDLNSVVNGDEVRVSLPASVGIGNTPEKDKRKGSLRRKTSGGRLNGNGSGNGNGGGQASREPSPLRQIQGSSSGTVSAGEGGVVPITPKNRGTRVGGHRSGVGNSGGGTEEDEVEDWAFGSMGGSGSPLVVRFEIYVVKVPWLPLHGIQFRRVGGDGWQYQMLAKTILKEMRL